MSRLSANGPFSGNSWLDCCKTWLHYEYEPVIRDIQPAVRHIQLKNKLRDLAFND